MRLAIIGRGEMLLEAAHALRDSGHEVALVITAKEAPEYTANVEDFSDFASKANCPFVRTAKITPEIVCQLSSTMIDLAISVNYPTIIAQNVIQCFRLGILNAHGGDLPRYRGNACQAWAIINGEKRVGLCIHKMTGLEIDAGDIIVRDYHPIEPKTTVTDLLAWMKSRVPLMFAEAIRKLDKNPDYVLERQSGDPKKALRCYPRRPEDGRIDWGRRAVDIVRLVNASTSPYAGAFCELDGRKLILWDAEQVDDGENFLSVPGQVAAIGESWVDVTTGQGKIRINEVEIDGVRVTPEVYIKSLRTRLR